MQYAVQPNQSIGGDVCTNMPIKESYSVKFTIGPRIKGINDR